MGAVIFVLLTIIFFIAVGIHSLVSKAQKKRDEKENKSGNSDYILSRNENPNEIGGSNLDRFYIECILAGCDESTLDDPQVKNKVELLAKKYNLSITNGISGLFQEGKKVHLAIRNRGVSAKLNQMRSVEKAEYDAMIKYAELSGRDKKKRMLKDEIDLLRKQASESSKNADNLMRAGYQKENDWAIMGGIASGIAGPGAGVVTALDTQAQNAQIRAQNQAYANAALPAFINMTGSAQSMRSRADALEKEMKEVDEKLVSELSSQQVFDMLSFQDSFVAVSDTGAYRVNVNVEPRKKLTIGNFPAVIDGTIDAHVKANGAEIGVVKIVFPANGISQTTKLGGIALSGAEKDLSYSVEFSPYKLWLMEK